MGVNYNTSTVTDSLRLYYDAANQRSYPGTGTTVYDVSGNPFNGYLYTGSSYSNGTFYMDGSTGMILAPSVNDMGAMPNQSYEIWVKSPGLGSGKVIGGLICPDYGQLFYINSSGSVSYVLFSTDSGSTVQIVRITTTGVNCFDNKWHHVVCTRDSTDAKIYVDTVVRATGSGGGSWTGKTQWSGMQTQIGNNPNDVYYNLKGNIGVAKIYYKALSASEVTQNYNALRGRYGV